MDYEFYYTFPTIKEPTLQDIDDEDFEFEEPTLEELMTVHLASFEKIMGRRFKAWCRGLLYKGKRVHYGIRYNACAPEI